MIIAINDGIIFLIPDGVVGWLVKIWWDESELMWIDGIYPAAVVVSLLRLEEAGGRARIGILINVDADVIIIADVLLLLVIPPVLLGRIHALERLLASVRATVVVLFRVSLASGLAGLARFHLGHAQAEGVLLAHHRRWGAPAGSGAGGVVGRFQLAQHRRWNTAVEERQRWIPSGGSPEVG